MSEVVERDDDDTGVGGVANNDEQVFGGTTPVFIFLSFSLETKELATRAGESRCRLVAVGMIRKRPNAATAKEILVDDCAIVANPRNSITKPR